MRTKRFLSMIVAICIIATSITAFASTSFTDVTQKTHGWAMEAIESMSRRGILKGYDDVTFGPDDPITKIQSLIIMSRILGVNDIDNEFYTETALNVYEEYLKPYETEYKNEIAYLLYRGVIFENELTDYISDKNINSPLKRYEAAILLTKLAGAEEKVLTEGFDELEFVDYDAIPTNAKAYVSYVKENGLMNGISETEFAPQAEVTRAMMATMMYRVENKMNVEVADVTVVSVNPDDETVTVESGTYSEDITFPESVRIVIDGIVSTATDLIETMEIRIYAYDGEYKFVEATASNIQMIVTGTVLGTSNVGDVRKLSVTPISGTNSSKVSYPLDPKCLIYVDEKGSTINNLTQGTYVKLTIKGGIITRIDASKKEQRIEGKIVATNFTTEASEITIEAEGSEQTYGFSENVSVVRNTVSCDMRELAVGDMVSATVMAGTIKKINATSLNKTVEGTIEEIHITTNPTIVVNVAGKPCTYSITSSTVFDVATSEDETGTIYDLRQGATASIKLSSENVESITTQKVVATPALIGTVSYIYPSNRVIGIDVIDPVTGDVSTVSAIVKSTCTVTDVTTSKVSQFKNITVGRSVVAVGTSNYGAYEITSITITN